MVNKIVITGGFGFIGAKMVNHFKSKNIEVVVLEHPESRTPKNYPKCEIVRADITERTFIDNLKLDDIDVVLHLAAQSSGPKSFSIPDVDIKINILGTLNVIDWCIALKTNRLLFASSFVIYGDHPEKELLDEQTEFLPKSVYATSKLAGEHLMRTYAQQKGINWNALRMFNVYGPGQDITKSDQGVVGIFMNMLLKQDIVQVKGKLNRFRDLIHVDDVIQGWDLCLHSSIYNQSYNLGSGHKTTYEDLILSIAKVLGKSDFVKIEELSGTPGDMMGCYADLTKIKENLNYFPKYNLEKGLESMHNWIKEQKN